MKLLSQVNTGPFLGAFKDLASRTMVYVSALSFFQVTATFYNTTLKPSFLQYVPWLSFWIYFLTLVVIVLLIMLFEYKFIVPSTYTFINRQEYIHENLIRKDLVLIKAKLGIEKLKCPHCGKEIG